MIGIRQDDARVQIVGQIALREALHGGLRADGHEDRGFDDAVRRMQQSGACARNGTLGLDFKSDGGHYKDYSKFPVTKWRAAALMYCVRTEQIGLRNQSARSPF